MDEVYTISLEDRVRGGASIEFLQAEVPIEESVPFVLVRYAINGVPQHDRLSLDVGKQVFYDHFEDAERERVVQDAAPHIVDIIGEELYSNGRASEA